MSFKKTLLKNVAVFGSYDYITLVLEFISTMILSRLLLPEEYGFVAIIVIFSGFIEIFSNAGLSQAIIRTDYGAKFFRLIFSFSVWISFALFMVMALLAYPISLFYENKDLFLASILIAIQFITNSFTIVPSAILLKKLRFNEVGKFKLFSHLIYLVLMIFMAYLGYSYWSLIVPGILRPIFFYFFLERKIKFGVWIYGWKHTKLSFKYITNILKSYSLFNVINYWARNVDNFLIGKVYGEFELGIYSRAYRFLSLGIRLINSVFGNVLFPSLKKEIEEGKDYKEGFLEIVGIIHFLGLLFATALVVFPEFLVKILWGENWLKVADFMPYFGAIIPLQTSSIASMDLYVLNKKEKALISIGIPSSLILVVAIVFGAFFSSIHIARFYALMFVVIQLPFLLIFGHNKILGFEQKKIILFWGPKIVLTFAILLSLWFFPQLFTNIIVIVYIGYSIIEQKANLVTGINFLLKKIRG